MYDYSHTRHLTINRNKDKVFIYTFPVLQKSWLTNKTLF